LNNAFVMKEQLFQTKLLTERPSFHGRTSVRLFSTGFSLRKRVAINGYLILDDTQLKAVRILRDFLETEEGRWELMARFGRTDIFRKVSRDISSASGAPNAMARNLTSVSGIDFEGVSGRRSRQL
jgi:hypothetical protein